MDHQHVRLYNVLSKIWSDSVSTKFYQRLSEFPDKVEESDPNLGTYTDGRVDEVLRFRGTFPL